MATHSSVLALENPRDGGARWAAVYGVTQSRTRLKRLSSSSSNNGFRNSKCFYGLWWFGGLVANSCSTLVTQWTVACQVLLSMGFSRQEYWSLLQFSSPEDLPDPGIQPRSPALQADSLSTELQGKLMYIYDLY